MNHLLEYIRNIFETTGSTSNLYRFITESIDDKNAFVPMSFDECDEYFKQYDLYNKTNIRPDDLRELYNHPKASYRPVVANYKDKPGQIVLRKWTEEVMKHIQHDSNYTMYDTVMKGYRFKSNAIIQIARKNGLENGYRNEDDGVLKSPTKVNNDVKDEKFQEKITDLCDDIRKLAINEKTRTFFSEDVVKKIISYVTSNQGTVSVYRLAKFVSDEYEAKRYANNGPNIGGAIYHNTKLDENGMGTITAADWENLICIAYNALVYSGEKFTFNEIVWKASGNSKKALSDMEKLQKKYMAVEKEAQEVAKLLYKALFGGSADVRTKNKTYVPLEKLETPNGKTAKEIRTKLQIWDKAGKFTKSVDEVEDTPEVSSSPSSLINLTPKTDIISEKIGDKDYVKISCKKAGGSQLMSGTANESIATLFSVLIGKFDNGEKKEYIYPFLDLNGKNADGCLKNLNDTREAIIREMTDLMNKYVFVDKDKDEYGIFDPIPKGKTISQIKKIDLNDPNTSEADKELKRRVDTIDSRQKDFNKELSEIFRKYPEYKYYVCYEAATGFIKFNCDIPEARKAIPNFILEFDTNNPNEENTKLYTITQYLQKHIENGTSDFKIIVSFKTSNNAPQASLRIIS